MFCNESGMPLGTTPVQGKSFCRAGQETSSGSADHRAVGESTDAENQGFPERDGTARPFYHCISRWTRTVLEGCGHCGEVGLTNRGHPQRDWQVKASSPPLKGVWATLFTASPLLEASPWVTHSLGHCEGTFTDEEKLSKPTSAPADLSCSIFYIVNSQLLTAGVCVWSQAREGWAVCAAGWWEREHTGETSPQHRVSTPACGPRLSCVLHTAFLPTFPSWSSNLS